MKKWFEVGVGGGHGYGVMAETPEDAIDQVWNSVFAHAVDVNHGYKLFEKKDLQCKEIAEGKLYHIIPAE